MKLGNSFEGFDLAKLDCQCAAPCLSSFASETTSRRYAAVHCTLDLTHLVAQICCPLCLLGPSVDLPWLTPLHVCASQRTLCAICSNAVILREVTRSLLALPTRSGIPKEKGLHFSCLAAPLSFPYRNLPLCAPCLCLYPLGTAYHRTSKLWQQISISQREAQ